MEVPKFSDEAALAERLVRLLQFQPREPDILVTRFPSWKFGFFKDPVAPGEYNLLAVGLGVPERVPFRDSMLEAALHWLASDDAAWVDALQAAMPHPLRGVEHPELAPDEEVVAQSLQQLFTVVGDLGMSHQADLAEGTVTAVDLLALSHRLGQLRPTLLLAVALHSIEQPASFYAAIERQIEATDPGLVAQMQSYFGEPERASSALVRVFMLAGMQWFYEGALQAPASPGGPAHADARPRNPLQLMWLVAASSVGAIVPPYPLPGVYQCAYHRCQRVFLSKKTKVSGKLRFCCPEHGKRFYAARRMKEKSARARNASQTPEE
mgnify:CR=1 FL=1